MPPPDLRESALADDSALADAVIYYGERASRVSTTGTNRKQLRALLVSHDLRVAEILSRWRAEKRRG